MNRIVPKGQNGDVIAYLDFAEMRYGKLFTPCHRDIWLKAKLELLTNAPACLHCESRGVEYKTFPVGKHLSGSIIMCLASNRHYLLRLNYKETNEIKYFVVGEASVSVFTIAGGRSIW